MTPDPQIETLSRLAGSPAASLDDGLFIAFEYSAGLRELALAEAVLERTRDPDIRSLATIVRDGHRKGLGAMQAPAATLGLTLPTAPTALDQAMIRAALKLPPDRLDAYFLRRQRTLHAWDIASFGDYAAVATDPALKAYVEATIAPLREHAALVDRLAQARGLPAANRQAR